MIGFGAQEASAAAEAKPAHANPEIWQAGCKANPDPLRFVPVLACGFDDLQKRIKLQNQEAQAISQCTRELTDSVSTMLSREVSLHRLTLDKLQSNHAQIVHRLMRLLHRLHLARAKGCEWTSPGEDELLQRFLEMYRLCSRDEGTLSQRLANLQERCEDLSQQHEQLQKHNLNATADSVRPALQLDSAQKARMQDILETQTVGIEFLSQQLTQDAQLLDSVAQRAQLQPNFARPPQFLGMTA